MNNLAYNPHKIPLCHKGYKPQLPMYQVINKGGYKL